VKDWTYRQLLAAILLAGLALRLLLALILPPGYDESYYLFYGQNLALSYFDHPLMVGLWAAAGQGLPLVAQANPVLALRLPGLLSYSAAVLLLAEASRLWFGQRAALGAAAIASASPLLFACGGLLLLPDSPLILLLSLLLWWLARHPLHGSRTPRQSLGFGLILGLLSLCKYHALLLILTLVVARLVDSARHQRWRWADTGLVLVGWLAASWPLWLWNLQNGWLSFAFHTARTGAAGGFRFEGPPLFLLSQVALLFPTVGLLLLAALVRGPRPAAASPEREGVALLRLLALPQLLVFLLLAGRMQVLSSWLVPAWWLLVPLGGRLLSAPELGRRLWLRRTALLTAVAVPVLSLVAALHVRWGIAAGLLPPSIDTSGQLMEPAALRQALRQHPRIWRALQNAQVIGSNRYELPGFMALALQGHSAAGYTTYSTDNRGFDQWRRRLRPDASRGVLFAVVGDYAPLASLQQVSGGQPWVFGQLTPLGQVELKRGGQSAALLEFYAFDPSRVRRQGPSR
jgi:4-amino-4-deoxy-L-arabinose transferase-like glycosyltransferase